MENKDKMIEEWAKLVKSSKKVELSDESTQKLISVILNRKEIDEDKEFIESLENKKLGIGSAFWLRVKHCHTYTVTPSLVLYLISDGVLSNFGMSTMMANYLQYVCHEIGITKIGIEEFCRNVFPWGLPSEEEWNTLWDLQKLPAEMRESGMSDNMLDYPQLFGKSIMTAKE